MPCHKPMTTFVPSGFHYREITVRCGSTSPDGTPFLCDECAEKHAGRDWRREAELDGERWEELD